jgi:hypothetical protein
MESNSGKTHWHNAIFLSNIWSFVHCTVVKIPKLKAECLTIFENNFASHFNVFFNPSTLEGIENGTEILRIRMTQL